MGHGLSFTKILRQFRRGYVLAKLINNNKNKQFILITIIKSFPISEKSLPKLGKLFSDVANKCCIKILMGR